MLREDSRPYRLDPETLETIEVGQFGNLGCTALTAHPKIDPKTGEWWSYGVFARGEPTTDASLHVFDKDGRLIREEWFHTPYPGLSHDWGVTREHLVFPIMPLTADDRRLRAGGQYYQYDPDLPSAWGRHAARRLGRPDALVPDPRHRHGPRDERLYRRRPRHRRHPGFARATASASSRTSTATCPRWPRR